MSIVIFKYTHFFKKFVSQINRCYKLEKNTKMYVRASELYIVFMRLESKFKPSKVLESFLADQMVLYGKQYLLHTGTP